MRWNALYLLCFLLFAASCAISKSSKSSRDRIGLVKEARKQIGDKYKYGSKGPNRFDCSGLVNYVYKSEGYNVTGSAASLSAQGKVIPYSAARPGDLVFYKKQGKVFHVSIIVEIRKDALNVVHSTSSRGVIEEDIMSSPYWRSKMYKIISLNSLRQ